MIRITFNRKTQTYTVSNGTRVVRNIPVKSQAVAVRIELLLGDAVVSFGVETVKTGA